MAISTKTVTIDGTLYTWEYRDIRFLGGDFEVDLYMERDGDSAIISDGQVYLYVNERLDDEKSASPFGSGNTVTLTANNFLPGDSIEIRFESDQWLDSWSGSVSFTDTLPQQDASVLSAWIEPKEPTTSDRDNGDLKHFVEIENNGPYEVAWFDMETDSPGGQDTWSDAQFNVPSGETKTLGLPTFILDTLYAVSEPIPTGDYRWCVGPECVSWTLTEPGPDVSIQWSDKPSVGTLNDGISFVVTATNSGEEQYTGNPYITFKETDSTQTLNEVTIPVGDSVDIQADISGLAVETLTGGGTGEFTLAFSMVSVEQELTSQVKITDVGWEIESISHEPTEPTVNQSWEVVVNVGNLTGSSITEADIPVRYEYDTESYESMVVTDVPEGGTTFRLLGENIVGNLGLKEPSEGDYTICAGPNAWK